MDGAKCGGVRLDARGSGNPNRRKSRFCSATRTLYLDYVLSRGQCDLSRLSPRSGSSSAEAPAVPSGEAARAHLKPTARSPSAMGSALEDRQPGGPPLDLERLTYALSLLLARGCANLVQEAVGGVHARTPRVEALLDCRIEGSSVRARRRAYTRGDAVLQRRQRLQVTRAATRAWVATHAIRRVRSPQGCGCCGGRRLARSLLLFCA